MSREMPECPVCESKANWTRKRRWWPARQCATEVLLYYRAGEKQKTPPPQWQALRCSCGGGLLIEWRQNGRARLEILALIDLSEGFITRGTTRCSVVPGEEF